MIQEEKQLLLADLCARLPYGVKIQHPNYDEPQELDTIFNYNTYVDGIIQCACDDIDEIVEHKNSLTACRPYLRPMSSMTEEEIEELKTLSSIYIPTDSPTIGFEEYGIVVFMHHLTNNTYSFKLRMSVIDWLNAHHFDYRGLIEKGLAIAVTEDNDPYEE